MPVETAATGYIRPTSWQDYCEIIALNPSLILKARKSLKHFKWHLDNPSDKTTDALRLGTLSHAAILEPDRDLLSMVEESLLEPGKPTMVIWSGGRRYGKAWNDFQEEHKHQTIVTQKMLDDAHALCAEALLMADAVHDHKFAMSLLDKCEFEVAAFTDYEGQSVKGRLDAYKPGCIPDLKTSKDVSARPFGNDAAKFNYHVRLGCYKEFVTRITGQVPECWLIAVEKEPPYDVVCYRVDDAVTEWGWKIAADLLNQIKWGYENGKWPGINDGFDELHFPNWAMPNDEELQW